MSGDRETAVNQPVHEELFGNILEFVGSRYNGMKGGMKGYNRARCLLK
jgi:hypothetical protein